MIKADNIANKEFKKSLFGYDREDVDRYLDELIVQLRQMEEERKEMVSTIGVSEGCSESVEVSFSGSPVTTGSAGAAS